MEEQQINQQSSKQHHIQSKNQQLNEIFAILETEGGFMPEQINELNVFINDDKINRILGSIFGSMIGDALGSYCQFLTQIPPHIEHQVMQMLGGGTFKTILPGQYTDDNQLAYHLLTGLLTFNPSQEFEEQKLSIIKSIGKQFIRWIGNHPFDVGNTCDSAIYILKKNQQHLNYKNNNHQKIESQIFKAIDKANKKSQSNGSLMRITPMAAFISLLGLDPLQLSKIQFIKNEIRLTHPNQHLQSAGLAWVALLSQLINRKSNSQEQFKKYFSNIKDWFQEARKVQDKSIDASKDMGWAKIGFSYGIKFLWKFIENEDIKGSDLYKKWIKWVILRAGDTDTNAAISGGVIGAVIGFKELPIQYLKKVFKVKFNQKLKTFTTRPTEYEPTNFLRKVIRLINICKHYCKNISRRTIIEGQSVE